MSNSSNGRRIVIVEDEFLIAMLLEDMLGELGYIVAGTAANKTAAFELIDATEFDAAVLDVNIEGADSYDIARTLRDRKVPFIFATGHGSARLDPEFAGAPVLQKPYVLDDLARAIGALTFADKPLASS